MKKASCTFSRSRALPFRSLWKIRMKVMKQITARRVPHNFQFQSTLPCNQARGICRLKRRTKKGGKRWGKSVVMSKNELADAARSIWRSCRIAARNRAVFLADAAPLDVRAGALLMVPMRARGSGPPRHPPNRSPNLGPGTKRGSVHASAYKSLVGQA